MRSGLMYKFFVALLLFSFHADLSVCPLSLIVGIFTIIIIIIIIIFI